MNSLLQKMAKNTTISIPLIDLSLSWQNIAKMLLLIMLLMGISITVVQMIGDPNNYRKNTEQNSESSGNGSRQSNSKLDIKIDAQKKMYQEGDHFNKHGRSMGYGSKKEYSDAALKFAQENSTNPNAQIFEGQLNMRASVSQPIKQIVISYENRSVVLDKITGQIMNFYEGCENRALINMIRIQ